MKKMFTNIKQNCICLKYSKDIYKKTAKNSGCLDQIGKIKTQLKNSKR